MGNHPYCVFLVLVVVDPMLDVVGGLVHQEELLVVPIEQMIIGIDPGMDQVLLFSIKL